jgi:uncharacterized protein YegP (UPF0339 family)
MAAKFVLKKGSTGKYRFNLVATNGQIIATSKAMRAIQCAEGYRVGETQRPNAEVDDQTDR